MEEAVKQRWRKSRVNGNVCIACGNPAGSVLLYCSKCIRKIAESRKQVVKHQLDF